MGLLLVDFGVNHVDLFFHTVIHLIIYLSTLIKSNSHAISGRKINHEILSA